MADQNIDGKEAPPPTTGAEVGVDPITVTHSPVPSKTSSANIASAEHSMMENNTGPDPDVDLTLWQSVRKYRRVVYYALGMTSAILMYGYDYVIIGTISAMPSFQRDFGELFHAGTPKAQWILPSLWLGLWNFISPGLSMPGAIVAGWFQDRFGRRASLAVGSFLSAVGVAICYVSNLPDASSIDLRRGLFFLGKGIQGAAIGMVMATAQTYLSEILPPTLRGPLLAFFPIFTLLGQVIGALVIFACLEMKNGYTIAFASQWVFSALPIIMAFVLPESPTFLVRRGRDGDAIRMQRRFMTTQAEPIEGRHGDAIQTKPKDDSTSASEKSGGEQVQTAETAESIVARIKRNIELEKEHNLSGKAATYMDCFRGENLKRTGIVMFAALIPQLFGLTLLSKASYFVQIVGMKADLSVIVLILGIVVGLLANIASMWVVNRFERRVLIMGGLGIAALLWGGMGIAGIWSGPVVVWYTSATMIAVITICGLGAWPCSFAVGAETSALDLRAKTQGIGWFTAGAASALFGFVLPYIFNPDQGDLRAKTGFVFTGLCVIGVVITYFYVPDMKDRTQAEIDHMFDLGLSARKFAAWKNPGGVAERHETAFETGKVC
ncbi:maltose permease [Rhypophila decipiens]|uniref:Maltose permease n=1 Tax=Rhypophila decipiens TaxID=261697 RepID=A0AAN6Y7M7_9PEZI|nr:maltose permease [Rhypophila decipiens]